MNDTLLQKEKKAIECLKMFEPQDEPYYLCYSGGKDSDVIRILAQLAGVKHDIVHNLTTVDAPETVNYIKSIPNVRIDLPELSMWRLIEKKKMPPTRLMRYCCETQKEHGGKGRLKITGVRWAESNNRRDNAGLVRIIGKPKTVQKMGEELNADFMLTKKGGVVLNNDNDESRRLVEQCYRTSSTMVNPIVDWEDNEVWEFLRYYNCRSNPLYECGKKRIGCIMCPMLGGKKMIKEGEEYPVYRDNYIRAFDRMLTAREMAGLPTLWESGKAVMRWWTGDNPDQMQMTDYFEEF